jgi:kynurenine formamidase
MAIPVAQAGMEPPEGLDRIGADQLLHALGLVRKAQIHDLATTLGDGMPQGPRDTFYGFRLTQFHIPRCIATNDKPPADWAMDVITASPHLGTHVDGLMHWQSNGLTFGGHDAREVYSDHGWSSHGMECSRPIIGRGILLDVARSRGEPCVPPGYEINVEDLRQCLATEAVAITPGDIVLVRTGWLAARYESDPEAYFASNPGVGPEAAIWLAEQGMSVLGTDTSGTEVIPLPDPHRTTHVEMLVKRGIHLIEILDLESIARDRIYESLFVGLPLKIAGATGSWLRPVAIA